MSLAVYVDKERRVLFLSRRATNQVRFRSQELRRFGVQKKLKKFVKLSDRGVEFFTL